MNVFTATGRLGRDVEVRTTQGGTTVANLAIAVDAGYGDNKKTLWVHGALFGKRAEGGLIQYLTKGQQIAVSGELSMSSFQKQDGTPGQSLEMRITEIDPIGGGQQQGQQGNYQSQQPVQQRPQQQQQRPPQQYQPQQPNQYAQQSGGYAAPQHGAPQGFDDFNDEIPF